MSDIETQRLVIQVAGIQMRHVERVMYLLLVVVAYGVATIILYPILKGDILTIYIASWPIPLPLFRWIMRAKRSLWKKRKKLEEKEKERKTLLSLRETVRAEIEKEKKGKEEKA
jgi:hypothetical protein